MVWKDTKLLEALCVDMELEVLVRKCTNSNEMSELTHMLPMEETAAKTKFSKKNTELNKIIKKEYEIDMQKIASQTKISKKNAELVLSIIKKRLKSNKLEKITNSLHMLIYLIRNGGEIFQAALYEMLQDLLGILNHHKIKKLLTGRTETYKSNFYQLLHCVTHECLKAHLDAK
ncbi:hypothetical protein QYM36_001237 [Artemia franciscana]|uniref:Uncharacterized protein n=1 Tax=Artemia franciscana TaxID=6661 RepID=A0AA88IA13_ARTSF|nr:hypothetical protein QYM36_019728 [Artemia franciscana]KAK2724670.1 hypothetical protein QYM36_001237 [Artemia franciscana]